MDKKNEWTSYTENGKKMWEHPELGLITQTEKGFTVMYPKIIHIGPFTSIEKAKMLLEEFRDGIDNGIKKVGESFVMDSANWDVKSE